MRALDLRVAASTGDVLGESPTWDARDGALYWVDLRAPALRRLHAATAEVRSWTMPEVIGAVVQRASGGLVVALKHGLFGFDPATERLDALATVETGRPENRLNDARCDPAGRIFCGSMWDFGAQTTGALYRVDADRSVTRIRTGVTIANAIAFAPAGRTIYFADTRAGSIERAGYDPASGTVGAWSVLAAPEAAPGRPDGATVDAEGFVWNARYGGGCLARFSPDGRLDRIAPLPVSQPTSCAFGGEGFRTLFVTTSRQRLSEAQRAAEPLAGSLLALDVGVAGLAEPRYAG
jgi:sugar lactone lactonase YvrE